MTKNLSITPAIMQAAAATASRHQAKKQTMRSFSRGSFITVLGMVAILLPTLAIAASGQFTYVAGNVQVESGGQRKTAIRGMEVNPGDVIISGPDGMAQLSMIDLAKLSLRSNSQLKIERYQKTASDQDGAILSLLRGTMRTFTGLLSGANREKYLMKTRVATVGIRGSGNILSHEEEGGKVVTINHTIEGSHIVTSLAGNFAPFISFPNDTVKVELGRPPEKIPTPPQILSASNTMVGKETPAQVAVQATGGTTPLPVPVPTNTPTTGTGTTGGGTTAGTNIVNPQVLAVPDPSGLRDIVLAGAGNTYSGQALPSGITLENGNLRSFSAAPGGSSTSATIVGGTIANAGTIDLGDNSSITFGRWNAPASSEALGFGSLAVGGTHFIYGSSGYPPYLSDVLSGTVVYTQAGATTPTNQSGAAGAITSTLLSVNFTQRLLNATIALSMPTSAGTNNYTLQASNVPFSLNSFFTFTGFGLTVTNNTTNQNSNNNFNIFGQIEGSFVGSKLNGVILGYGFVDGSAATNVQSISGVLAFRGPAQNTAAPFRYGLISDSTSSLSQSSYSQTYATINRPEEVNIDANGRAISFVAPYARGDGTINGRTNYAIGTSQAFDTGVDATTGLSWGRWSGASATIGGVETGLAGRSQHYIFSAAQSVPTALPLTGTASYDVIGSTHPTDFQGNVGNLNSATLNANFSARTVDTSVNLTIAGQTWNASANGVPIYRDMTFAVNTGGAIVPGLPTPVALNITCAPSCTQTRFTGSIDGFFTGATGRGAGLMYNLNNSISGAVALRRRGG